jgi:hypothetical protein
VLELRTLSDVPLLDKFMYAYRVFLAFPWFTLYLLLMLAKDLVRTLRGCVSCDIVRHYRSRLFSARNSIRGSLCTSLLISSAINRRSISMTTPAVP